MKNIVCVLLLLSIFSCGGTVDTIGDEDSEENDVDSLAESDILIDDITVLFDEDADGDNEYCTSGETRTESCGLNQNGIQTMICTMSGEWEKSGECKDPDECVNDDTQESVCGFNDRGKQPFICKSGKWLAVDPCDDDDFCVDETERLHMLRCYYGEILIRQQMCVYRSL